MGKQAGWGVSFLIAPITIFIILVLSNSPGAFEHSWFSQVIDTWLAWIGIVSMVFGGILMYKDKK